MAKKIVTQPAKAAATETAEAAHTEQTEKIADTPEARAAYREQWRPAVVSKERWAEIFRDIDELEQQQAARKAEMAAQDERWRKKLAWFRTSHEEFSAPDNGDESGEAALIYNPRATALAFAAAAEARAAALHSALSLWSCVDRDVTVSASEFADALIGDAFEIKQLIGHLLTRIPAQTAEAEPSA